MRTPSCLDENKSFQTHLDGFLNNDLICIVLSYLEVKVIIEGDMSKDEQTQLITCLDEHQHHVDIGLPLMQEMQEMQMKEMRISLLRIRELVLKGIRQYGIRSLETTSLRLRLDNNNNTIWVVDKTLSHTYTLKHKKKPGDSSFWDSLVFCGDWDFDHEWDRDDEDANAPEFEPFSEQTIPCGYEEDSRFQKPDLQRLVEILGRYIR